MMDDKAKSLRANPLAEAMWQVLDQELIAKARASMPGPVPAPASATSLASVVQPAAPVADLRLEQDVRRIAVAALRIPSEQLDPTEKLSSYGIDSIAITELMVQISRFFGISIAPTTFFEAKHLDDLSAILRARYSKVIAKHYGELTPPAPAPAIMRAPTPTAAPVAESVATSPTLAQAGMARDVSAWLKRHRSAPTKNAGQSAAAKASAEVGQTSAPQVSTPASTAPSANTAHTEAHTEAPIAIIGMAGRFPQSVDLAALQAHLRNGDDCISEIPAERWDWRSVAGDPKKGPYTDVKYGGFLPGHDLFDAAFFNISPKEAELMDPQHRLFIECVWQLLDNAGYAASALAGKKVSVLLGINLQDYTTMVNQSGMMEAVQMTGLGHIFCPNRISFMLDVHGPSQVIDTACSSSLVAIHRAVMSIRHEGCEMAIAGGANLMLTPTQHIMFSKVGMLSQDGRCKTFADSADGYSRAEGIGAVLLKRLDLAERDGDQILGVIRGSVENHGGMATSLTAPNPLAQAQLIVEAQRQAGVDPRSVSLIECHGTGTALGDPIEINGLKAAFAQLYREWGHTEEVSPHCGLGSIKSNIGHAETAAGVAGLLKVLLAMQDGIQYKSLHCEQPNPQIELAGSPFYLLNQARPWQRLVVDGVEVPRRAGLSSFGAGGAMVHLLVEEYRTTPRTSVAADGAALLVLPLVLPLSAKNEGALREMARRLATHLQQGAALEQSLFQDLAYTLQLGRDAMRVRLACVANNSLEFVRRLQAFAVAKEAEIALIKGIEFGTLERGKRHSVPALDPTGFSAAEIAARWVQGANVDWQRAYPVARQRLALPSYPFAGKRYWLETSSETTGHVPQHSPQFVLQQQAPERFTVALTGKEFFLNDHRVQGQAVLPGVAYLELAWLAASRCGFTAFQIKQVVWLKTMVVNAPLTVEIAVLRDGSGWPRIEISSVDAAGARQLHAQARIVSNENAATPEVQALAQLQAAHPRQISAQQVYRVFDAMQINYGPSHRAISSLALGLAPDGTSQVLAHLQLPASAASLHAFTLHPSLLDGAFQAALGVALDSDGKATGPAALPFALDAVEILAPCRASMWVHIRSAPEQAASARVRTLDLDLLDENGKVCVRMRGFATRILPSATSVAQSSTATLLFSAQWQNLVAPPQVATGYFQQKHVLFGEFAQGTLAAMPALLPDWQCGTLHSAANIAQCFSQYAQQVLARAQAILANRIKPILLQVVLPDQLAAPVFAGLTGMLRTITLEQPWLHCQLLTLPQEVDAQQLAQLVRANALHPQHAHVRHRAGQAQVQAWQLLSHTTERAVQPWRNDGVYLISGGAGALGQVLVQEVLSHAPQATLVLAGRSALTLARQQWLQERITQGAKLRYHQVDFSDAAAVQTLVQEIRERDGRLNGVVHAAGVLQDSLLQKKTTAQMAAVFAPKVAGAVHLDQAIGNAVLDFFIVFASISGVFGNPGQADYAAANAFLDGFSAMRETQRAAGQRHGRTLAIDWPLWRDGGMRLDSASLNLMRQTTGLHELESQAGFAALYRALASDTPQILVAAGDAQRVQQRVLALNTPALPLPLPLAASVEQGAVKEEAPVDAALLRSRVLSALLRNVSRQLKVAQEDLDPSAELTEYGFDSISFTQFANEINEAFALEIRPTVFFEYPTLASLSEHLALAYSATIASRLGIAPQAKAETTIAEAVQPSASSQSDVQTRVQSLLMASVSKQLKVALQDIDAEIELSEYGFDSISFTQFANDINQTLALEITPTLFFEYPTIGSLAQHLATRYSSALAQHLQILPSQSVVAAAPTPAPSFATHHTVPTAQASHLANPGKQALAPTAVAIIGMSAVLPQAPDVDSFWQNLLAGRDCISEIPPDRWDWRAYWGDPATQAGRTNVKWGGFIDGIAEFDAAFFGIAAPEARAMDPSQRLLLTQAWRAIEDAGYAPRSLSGSNTGVFIGTADAGYGRLSAAAGASLEGYVMTGLAPSLGPNRISFFLNLHGPSVAVETACSSALVAIHRAVEAITSGHCATALAGGVNTLLLPDSFVGFSKAGMLAPDGRCKTFSKEANGYARGEGVGVIFLKRLEDAERDGDRILAVIRSSAENHGGRASSLTAPNPKAQAELLRTAYRRAGFDPRTVSYIETHGTGTPLGDPIEVEALTQAFADLGQEAQATFGAAQAQPCAIGSVKSNIGHLELAAGIAGVIKVLLQMRHKTLVKSLHCAELNPYLKLDGSRFQVQRENQGWQPQDAAGNALPRRAGVSSFGFGGSNAHVVLEEYVPSVPSVTLESNGLPTMIVLSAKTSEQLLDTARQLHDAVHDEMPLAVVGYTLQVARDAMEHRLGFVATSMAQVRSRLAVFIAGNEDEGLHLGRAKSQREMLALLESDDDLRHSLAGLAARGKHDILLRLWVNGMAFDWRTLYPQTGLRRIALPGYPFAKTQYWVRPATASVSVVALTQAVHPLLQQDESDAKRWRYVSVLTGQEFFLRDHRLGEHAVLPGVAYLEMARAAVANAVNATNASSGVITLAQHTWLRPLVLKDKPVRVAIELQREPETAGAAFRYSVTSDVDGEVCLHSQGRASFHTTAPLAIQHDLAAMRLATPTQVDVGTCYQQFAVLGLQYGRSHRTMRELRRGEGLVLARLAIAQDDSADDAAYGLPPGLLDGALQAVLGFSALTNEGKSETAIPYALKSVEILGPCSNAMWAVLHSETQQEGNSYTIDLCDDAGQVKVRLQGFAVRAVPAQIALAAQVQGAQVQAAAVPAATATKTIAAENRPQRALQALTQIAARILEVEPSALEHDTELGEYGFDSIMMTEFASRTNSELGLNLTPADFFEFATLGRLAQHIASAPYFDRGLPAVAVDSPQQEKPLELAQPKQQASSANKEGDDPIVIVGLSCAFPQAPDSHAFWENLVAGKDCIRQIPPERWDWRAVDGDPKTEAHKTNVHSAGLIDGVFEFDPLFFGISPTEARLMDPQQRLLMQHVWKALEDAGHAPRSLAGAAVGLFVGTAASGYCDMVAPEVGTEGYAATGASPSVGPNRISYFLDWHGPSEPIETACSSSLVAIHRAIQAMRAGDCEMALAGGVNTIITPEAHINFAKAGMLALDGRCKTFSSAANGYGRGEGVGVLVLKRLSAAQRDGNSIYAVIRSTAVNHGGRANSLTAPNTTAQAQLLQTAYQRAGIDASTLGYIEAHGTGTALGDPVEVNALKAAFRASTGNEATLAHCGLGSVKSNIGHLELAAGVAGVIKVLLQMRHRTLVASLHCAEQNPYIDLQNSPFFIVKQNQAWPALQDAAGQILPRRAGVSSFGFGGVNAHVVLEEYLAPAPQARPQLQPACIVLSARDEAGLRQQALALQATLAREGDRLALPDLAYTLQVGREAMKYRLALEVNTLAQLQDRLQHYLAGQTDAVYLGKVESSVPAGSALPGESLAQAWVRGGAVDWAGLAQGGEKRLHLPTYPFARDEYRHASTLGIATQRANDAAGFFTLAPSDFYLRDHQINRHAILPAAASVEFVRKTFAAQQGGSVATPVLMQHLVWRQALVVAEQPVQAQVVLAASEGAASTFYLQFGEPPQVHVQGKISAALTSDRPRLALAAVQARCTQPLAATWLYERYAELGMEYGPSMRAVQALQVGEQVGENELLARLALAPQLLATADQFGIHPALLDGALQACLGLASANKGTEENVAALPFAMDSVHFFAPTSAAMWVHVREAASSATVRKFDLDLANDDGLVCVQIRGFSVRLQHARKTNNASAQHAVAEDRSNIAIASAVPQRDSAVQFFARILAQESGVAIGAIDAAAALEDYGIDSIMIVRLTDRLEQDFGTLPKTLFFEFRTLNALVDHFIAEYGPRLAELTGGALGQASQAGTTPTAESNTLPTIAAKPEANMAVAIIGVAGSYPGARTLEEFWQNLAAGRDSVSEIPANRWDHTQFYDPIRGKPGKSNSKWGGFIEDFDCFDPMFFNISPREAQYIDPQERIFLQCAWQAIEDAGYTRATLAASDAPQDAPQDAANAGANVGVFVGVMYEEYQLYGAEATQQGHPLALPGSPASIANRVSYFCNFHGPSMAVDSMCSSSLTAIHLACESLRAGSCAVALAGGVNLSLHPNKYLALGQGRFTSSNGRCESFGRGGDGYVPGEGVGAVLLKPLAQAIADGDQIYGVIRSSALNHGGKTNGYAVPNPQAQAAVISRAMQRAGIAPQELSYIEAHGTGTSLGDPIEIAALAKAFQHKTQTSSNARCAIGSVKSNIGHCESAAGIAGLSKVLLQLKHQQLVPSLHSQTLNPGIDFARSPFVVQQNLAPWARPLVHTAQGWRELPRIAGLSSFGAGGSNAHFVIEEYCPLAEQPSVRFSAQEPGVFPFSARTAAALTQVVQRFLLALDGFDDEALASVAHVLQEGREAFEVRLAVVASDVHGLRTRLQQWLAGGTGVENVFSAHSGAAQTTQQNMALQWAKGSKVAWATLRHGPAPRKLSLPSYPFARERFWVPTPQVATTPQVEMPARLPLMLIPAWHSAPLHQSQPAPARIVTVLFELDSDLSAQIQAQMQAQNQGACHLFNDAAPDIAQRFSNYAVQLLELVQSIVKQRQAGTLLQLLLPVNEDQLLLTGLSGLLRSAQLEHPSLGCQLIALNTSNMAAADVVSCLRLESFSNEGHIRYDGATRMLQRWHDLSLAPLAPQQPSALAWKDGGVYLITGGVGGIGLLLVEEIARSVRGAVVCVTSRSPLSPEVNARLQRISNVNASANANETVILHRCVDVTNAEQVAVLVQELTTSYQRLNGIVHAAGITKDKLLLRKDPAELRQVIAPKVTGLAHLDAASAHCELDFMLLFASVSGALGNQGQADYACGNAFMDAFAGWRNQQVARGLRHGHTIAFDWPYWADGGMRLPDALLAAASNAIGIAPLSTAAGMLALRSAMQARPQQVLVLDGDHARLRQMMQVDSADAPVQASTRLAARVVPETAQASVAIKASPIVSLRAKTVAYLSTLLSQSLMIPLAHITLDEPFDRYGIDSVLALQIIEQLQQDLGPQPLIPTTLLFEAPKIGLLADALLASHGAALQARFAEDEPPQPTSPQPPSARQQPDHSADNSADHCAPAQAATSSNDIAIIAVAGRYPDADTIEEFWDVLREGRDCVTEIPASRWGNHLYFAPEKGKPGASYCKWGGFLRDVDNFDAGFFGISARDAVLMEPQERLFLQTVWHLLERSCHTRTDLQQRYDARVGVFVGAMYQPYRAIDTDAASKMMLSLSSYASMANRVSFFFDLQGPSMALDSMCSSGLQAVHLACQSLQRGECKLAIAGGVNLTLHHDKYLGLSRAGMLGSHAESRSFAAGDGYLPAEGVGAVLLKPLAAALRDGDNVLAVIKGSASNHSGHSAGYAVPSMEVQARLIADNFRASQIDPRSISYVEAAANGSALGDTIELRALARAFQQFTPDTQFCAIGSVKSNMGHAEAASGMAQLTKVLLQLQHSQLVPSVRAAAINPALDFTSTPFMPQTQLRPWMRPHVAGQEAPLRATVSSFGAGGSNVHLILEEAPERANPPVRQARQAQQAATLAFPLSAQNPARLAEWQRSMHDFVAARPELDLAQLSHTLRYGRERMACQLLIEAGNYADLLAQLADSRLLERAVVSAIAATEIETDAAAAKFAPLILPGYPFARERYWLPAAPSSIATEQSTLPAIAPTATQVSQEKILLMLSALLGTELGVAPHAVQPDASFRSHGADSMFALRLRYMVAEEFGVDLSNRALEEQATPHRLAAYIAQQAQLVSDEAAPALVAEQTVRSMSEGQAGLWALQALYPESSAYNVPLAFRVEGVGLSALEYACRYVLASFPILSTIVRDDAEQEACLVPHVIETALQVLNVPARVDDVAFARSRALRPFALAQEAPIRFELLRGKAEIVLIVVHHYVFDGLSALMLTRCFWDAYERFTTGGSAPQGQAAADFSEFVAWQRSHLQSPRGLAELAYWKQQLAGDLPVLQLPSDRSHAAENAVQGQSIERLLTLELSRKARQTAQALGLSPAVFFLAVLKILVYRYTSATDIIVGVPAMARPQRRFAQSLGYFANVMPIRSQFSSALSVADLMQQLHTTLTDGLDHADYPFAALVRELGRKPDGQALYQVSYAYQNFFNDHLRGPLTAASGTLITHLPAVRQQGDGSFGIEIYEEDEALRIVAGYDAALFDAKRIEAMLDHFVQLAHSASLHTDSSIAALPMLSNAEQALIVQQWSRGPRLPERAGTLAQWIQQQALRTPQATALIVGEQHLSYAEMQKQAERMAVYLLQQGITPGMALAVCIERSVSSIVVLLAALQLGVAWVPLDASFPEQRLAQIVADLDHAGLLVDAAHAALANNLRANAPQLSVVIALDGFAPFAEKLGDIELNAFALAAESTAYIIYTSGSTGRPKGVPVTQGAIAAHCLAVCERFALTAADVVLQFASHHVDAALEQILPTLMSGATLVMRGKQLWSPEEFAALLAQHKMTVADVPPAYLRELLLAWQGGLSANIPSQALRLVIVGGEALLPETVTLWRHGPFAHAQLLNAYGPTEATITCTVHEVTPQFDGQSVPIGRPLAGGEVYVLDRDGNLVPEGIPGELHIGGVRVAQGYRNLPEQTAQRFIASPFDTQDGQARLYRTGDIVSFIRGSDGVLAFHGRVDEQVKIRGFRIELGEIESAMRSCGVRDAVALLDSDGVERGEHRIIAGIVAQDSNFTLAALQEQMETRLPSYMLPAAYVELAGLPMTPGGKLDRAAILRVASTQLPATANAERASQHPLERRLAMLWGQVLGFEVARVDVDFFAAGGHSLLAVRLLAAIQREFGQRWTIANLLAAPTIAQQAQLLALQSEATSKPSSLVLLRGQGKGLPLFCIHPVGGNVLCYLELARAIEPQRPVYGLQSPALEGDIPSDVAATSIAQMAAQYLAIIRQVQASGPYLLAGWSIGGVIAFEMAQQLRAEGEEVGMLTLIDSYAPALLQQLQQLEQDAGDSEVAQRQAFVRDLAALPSANRSGDTPAVLLSSAVDDRLFAVYQANSRAALAYKPRAYDGCVTLICAEEFQPDDATLGWGQWLQGKLAVRSMAGNHYSLLRAPQVQEVAEILSAQVAAMNVAAI